MRGWSFCLVGLLYAFFAQATTNDELLNNLQSRMKDLPDSSGTLIKSFTNHSQSFIYDQALAIIAFSKNKNQVKARELLNGLRSLQMKDGSLYFSYYLDGSSPYPQEGDKRIAGAMAWTALAAVHYQHQFKSKEFVSFNYRLLNYLHSQISSIEIEGVKMKALRFAPSDIKSTPFPEHHTAALEHNLDAYAAFLHFGSVNKTQKWSSDVKNLKAFILSMWDKKRLHFWSGADFKKGTINKSELYLDNQTWSLLALDSRTLNELAPADALDLNCDVFYVNHKGIKGFMDSRPARGPASHYFVWSEGTLGQVMAMRKLRKIKKKTVYCNEQTSQDILSSVRNMKTEDGGIAYSTTSKKKDFTTASSAAGTAWLYFAANDINPFEL